MGYLRIKPAFGAVKPARPFNVWMWNMREKTDLKRVTQQFSNDCAKNIFISGSLNTLQYQTTMFLCA